MEITVFACRRFILLCLGISIFQGIAASNKNCSTAGYSPVCSSNGFTYSNLCEFENAKSNNSDLVIIYQSRCPDACLKDCSAEPVSKVCSSNVQTFNNRCEFEKQKCLQKANWFIILENECATLPPPTPTRDGECKKHLLKVLFIDSNEYFDRCDSPELKAKSENGTLTFDDIKDCYDPRCQVNMHYYFMHQCDILHDYCWCANPDGSVIPNTFSKDLEKEACLKTCSYNDVIYEEGAEIPMKNTCGMCKCVDGNVTCSLKYNTTSPLDSTQIDDLKNDLLQMFFYQIEFPVQVDIIHTTKHNHPITSAEKSELLRTKFNQYDRDDSHTLSIIERHIFDIEVFKFGRCVDFSSQVFTLMDSNHDGAINLKEWGEFFDVKNLSRRKRSLSGSLDRLANRRKFKYILV